MLKTLGFLLLAVGFYESPVFVSFSDWSGLVVSGLVILSLSNFAE